MTECSVFNWEKSRFLPKVKYYPDIISFLGYNPFGSNQATDFDLDYGITTTMTLAEPYLTLGGIYISAGEHDCIKYYWTSYVYHSLPESAEIKTYWLRNSSSTLWGDCTYFACLDEANISISDVTHTGATLSGYVLYISNIELKY